MFSVVPGSGLAVPYAADLDKTPHWISDWGNQACWAVNEEQFLDSLETEN